MRQSIRITLSVKDELGWRFRVENRYVVAFLCLFISVICAHSLAEVELSASESPEYWLGELTFAHSLNSDRPISVTLEKLLAVISSVLEKCDASGQKDFSRGWQSGCKPTFGSAPRDLTIRIKQNVDAREQERIGIYVEQSRCKDLKNLETEMVALGKELPGIPVNILFDDNVPASVPLRGIRACLAGGFRHVFMRAVGAKDEIRKLEALEARPNDSVEALHTSSEPDKRLLQSYRRSLVELSSQLREAGPKHLVVWVINSSQKMEANRKALQTNLKTFSENVVSGKQSGEIRHAIIHFSAEPQFWIGPVKFPGKLTEAISAISSTKPEAANNSMSALFFAVKKFGNRSDQTQTTIVLVDDFPPDDSHRKTRVSNAFRKNRNRLITLTRRAD